MKKIICLLSVLFLLVGCQDNKKYDLFDTQGYNYVIMSLPNGEIIEGKIQYWRDFEGEQLEIKINDVIYLVSSYNCVLIYR